MKARRRPPPGRTALGLLHASALVLCGILGAGTAPEGSAQETPASPSPRSRILADRFIDRVVNGQPITYLYGNVVIDRDTVRAECDTALYYRQLQVYELRSRVRLHQHGSLLTCRHAVYRRDEGAADFFGDVRVEEEDGIGTGLNAESRAAGRLLRLLGKARLVTTEYTVWADSIVRDRDTLQGEASGDVKIVDAAARTLVTGGHALFSADGRSARVDVDPVLTSRERGAEPFEGRSRVMHFYRQDQRVVMVDSVRIVQGRTEAFADTAVAFGEERLLLRGRPRVHYAGQSTMTAREIEFLYRNRELFRILLRGAARMEDGSPDSLAAIYAGLPAADVLDGDTITVELEDGAVQRSTVVGHAHSLYVPTDVDDEIAFNDVVGDTIVIAFRDERVHRVTVRGNMSGTYRFARLTALAAADSAAAAAADSTATADSLTAAAETLGATPDTLAASPPDTAAVALTAADSLAAADGDTLGAPPATVDFLGAAEEVTYSGGQVIFRLADRRIEIARDGVLEYGTMKLTAEDVKFDTVARELYASGDPQLVDRDQNIVGDRMGYDFGHKTGAVQGGVTAFEGNYYDGDEIRRFADGSMKIMGGCMTACDLEEPHYHFWSDKMKIQLDDKVVAKPVVLKIGHVPVMALPFYFKSLKSGRRSGILFPSFNVGWSSRTGRYIRDFGYYWATNEYLDFTFEGDYNEREEFTYSLRNRYVKRYAFDGDLSYTRRLFLGDDDAARQWIFRWNHRQKTFLDYYNLSAQVDMSSKTLERRNLSSDVGQSIVSGQNHSTVYLSRSWSYVSANLNLTRDEFVNAEDDDPGTNAKLHSQTLPKLSLSFKSRSVLPPLLPGQDGSFLGDLLRNTNFSHGYNFQATSTRFETTEQHNYQAGGNASVDFRPPRLGFLDWSAGVRAGQTWRREEESGRLYETGDDTLSWQVRRLDEARESTSPSLSFNGGVRSTLYGVFPVRLGRLQAIRHTFSWSVGYTLRPALGSKQRRSEGYSFSVGNRFDVKYLKGSARDSTAQVGKLDGLLDWNLGTSYNPDAPADQRWQNISSTLSIKPGQSRNLNLKVNNTIDPYAWRILNTSLSYGLNLNGRFDTGGEVVPLEPVRNAAIDRLGAPADSAVAAAEGLLVEEEDEEEAAFADDFAGYARPVRTGDGKDPTEGGRFIPWNASVNLTYNRSNLTGVSSARGNLSFSAVLTRNWDFSYRTSIDFDRGQVTNQSWNLKRDLHCWALEFSRTVYGNDQEFGFRIYLKSIPAIKLTRGREGLLGGTGSQLSGGIF